MGMTLHLHIDRLVLDGLGPLNGDAVSAAAQAELARLLTESGVPHSLAHNRRQRRLDGGQFDLGTGAAGVGQQVAQRVFTTLYPHE